MPLNENDLSLLIDIVDCILDINEFTGKIGFDEFTKDKMCKLAVERQLEVIGQAAHKISKNTQDSIKNIPWGNIIGLRNKLAHDYGEILAERIWQITKKSIPELMNELEKIEEIKEYITNTVDDDEMNETLFFESDIKKGLADIKNNRYKIIE